MDIMTFFNVLPLGDQIHCRRVAAVSKLLAELLGRTPLEVDAVERSALFHDVGKAMNPRALRRVPAVMSEEDRAVVLKHTTEGEHILASRESFLSTAPIVARHHHEYLDGSGYLGLTDKAIHPHAKLVTVADVFDKLACCRPGEERRKEQEACAVLTQCAGAKLDAQVVQTLLDHVDQVRAAIQTANRNALLSPNTHS